MGFINKKFHLWTTNEVKLTNNQVFNKNLLYFVLLIKLRPINQ